MNDGLVYISLATGITVTWSLRLFTKQWAVYLALGLVVLIASLKFGWLLYTEETFQNLVASGQVLAQDYWLVYLSWFLKGALTATCVILGTSLAGAFSQSGEPIHKE